MPKNFNNEEIMQVFQREIKKVESTLERIDEIYKKDLRRLDRLSDRIAVIGGSWTFIACFFLILFIWIILNALVITQKPFDPYPFILMNLILSCLAAIQAPIILMSQNRAAKRDQARAEMDLEKDLRDLRIDMQSHKILLALKKEVEELKKRV